MSDWGQGNRTVHWFRRLDDAGRAWSDPRTVDASFDGADGGRALVAADLDGDGDLDLVGGSSFLQPRVRMWRNDGHGANWEAIDVEAGFAARSVALADLDADGRPEIVAGSWGYYTGSIAWWDPPCSDCRSDLVPDCAVGADDLERLLAAWGETGDPADLDADGTVGIGDLLILVGDWGDC